MHEIIPPSQLQSRLEAIGMSATTLAARANLHHTTIFRIMQGGNFEMASLQAVTRELLAEERRLQEHLNQLHPLPAKDIAS